jgi:hypothetical protein
MEKRVKIGLASGLISAVVIAVVYGGKKSGLMEKILPTMTSAAMKRANVVKIVAEERANPDPTKYWAEVLQSTGSHPPHWCGALVLYALRKAGLTNALWKIGSGFLYEQKLPQTKQPQPGDVAYFSKFQHHALVAEVLPDNQIVTYDGNDVGGSIGRHVRNLRDVTAFFSIDPMLKE